MADYMEIAKAIYGECASEDFDTMVMVGSSILNRLEAGRVKEFGADLNEVLQKGYYAVSNPNVPYKQASEGKFPDKKSEDAFKRAVQVASGLTKGTIERQKGMFYFTPDEEVDLRKAGSKKFNFKLVKNVGVVGKYNIYSY